MTAEVADIAQALDWPYHIIDDEPAISTELLDHLRLDPQPPEKLKYYGICFRPHASSEWVYLTFYAGKIVMPTAFQFLSLETKPKYFWGAFTKTQFAGPETHATVVNLLKYLESKYLRFTQLSDETGYWESDDKKQLVTAFEKMNFLFDVVEDALSTLEITAEDSDDTTVAKIEDVLRKLNALIARRKK